MIQFLEDLSRAEEIWPLHCVSQEIIIELCEFTLDRSHYLRVGTSVTVIVYLRCAMLQKVSQLLISIFGWHKSVCRCIYKDFNKAKMKNMLEHIQVPFKMII